MKGHRRGGRPLKSNKRQCQITVRLTADQYDQLRRQAGQHTVSAVVRDRVLGETTQEALIVPPLNRSAWIELARTAANINQLTQHANLGLAPDWDLILKELASLSATIAALRSAMIGGHNGNS